jgi:hypothetical protein
VESKTPTAAVKFAAVLAKRGIREVRILGVDFDNTITSGDTYPEISPFRPHAIEVLTEFQAAGGKVILLTCREGQYLDDALIALAQAGFVPDAVNQNLAQFAIVQGIRKVYVDLSIDDRNLGCPLDWKFIGQVLKRLAPKSESEKERSESRKSTEKITAIATTVDGRSETTNLDGLKRAAEEAKRLGRA